MTWEKRMLHEQWFERKMGPDIRIKVEDSGQPSDLQRWHWHVVVESMEKRQMLQMNGYAPTEEKGKRGALLCVAGFALAFRAAGDTLNIPTDDDQTLGALLSDTLHGTVGLPFCATIDGEESK